MERPGPGRRGGMTDLLARIGRLPDALRGDVLAWLRGVPPAEPEEADGAATPWEDEQPTTLEQQQLWVIERVGGGAVRQNVARAFHVRGVLDADALAEALAAIVRRHDVLRGVFRERGGRLVHAVSPLAPIDVLSVSDLDGTAGEAREAREAALRRRLAELAETAFDPALGPLFRAELIRLGPDEHVLAWVVHHLVWDGVSFSIFLAELRLAYQAIVDGRAPDLPPLSAGHADYAAAQAALVAGGRAEALAEHWRSRLHDVPPLGFPTDRPRPDTPVHEGAVVSRDLSREVTAAVTRLARKLRTTLFVVALSAFHVLLHRYTGQEAFVIASPCDGRDDAGLERALGYFVRMLPIPADLAGDPTGLECLRRTQAAVLEAFEHAELPLAKIVEAVGPERRPGRHPLFDVEFMLAPPTEDEASWSGLTVRSEPVHDGAARFDWSLVLRRRGDRLRASVQFSTPLFDGETMVSLLANYEQVLAELSAGPERRLSEIEGIADAERGWLCDHGEGPRAAFPHRSVVSAIEAQARRRPDAPALVHGETTLDYAGLGRATATIAGRLAALGVRPEDRVAIAMPRSADLILAIVGVLRSGGAYVPLDAAHPDQRLREVMADAGVALVVVGGQGDARVASLAPAGCPVASIGELLEPVASPPSPAPPAPDALAYVIYTSGSTGTPKGVAVEHRSVANYAQAIAAHYGIVPGDRCLQFFAVNFDASVQEVFGALCAGATLVVAGDEERYAPADLTRLMREAAVTVAELPAALLPLLSPDDLPALRVLSTGGEAFASDVVNRWRRPGRRVFNGYGPTETTVAVTQMEFVEPGVGGAPIGRPMANHRVSLRDARLRLVPRGGVGEVVIGGAGVARGYHARPDATAAAFVDDPDRPGSGERVYRTGDLARWNRGGDLEFLGRRDGQVKIRGYRIEVGEIEAVLEGHEAIAQAVVVVRGTGADRELVAYVRPRRAGGLDAESLYGHLAARLPGYMHPSKVMPVQAFALNSGGKIDRSTLPEPAEDALLRRPLQGPPETPIERTIAEEVFRPLLGREVIGVHEGFFELGGNSLQAAQLISRLRARFGVDASLAEFFQTPTVAGLASIVRARASQASAIEAGVIDDLRRLDAGRAEAAGLPVLPWQAKLLAFQAARPDSTAAHMRIAWRIEGPLDVDALAASVAEVVARHDALRTSFTRDDGGWRQVVGPLSTAPALRVVDAAGDDKVLWDRLDEHAATPFDVGRPLVRASLLRRAADAHALVVTVHHLAFDGWSSGLVQRDLIAAYNALAAGERPPAASPAPFARFVAREGDRLGGEAGERLRQWWEKAIPAAPDAPIVPAGGPADGGRPRSAYAAFRLGPPLTAALRDLGQRQGASPFMTLLAGFACFLGRRSGRDDLVVATPFAGRVATEYDDTVGHFAHALAVRLDLSAAPTVGALLDHVRAATGESYAHHGVPADALGGGRAPRALFALQNTPRANPAAAGLRVTPLRDPLDPILPPVLEFYSPAERLLDLSLAMSLGADGVAGLFEYNASLYRHDTVLAWRDELIETFAALAESGPAVALDRLGPR